MPVEEKPAGKVGLLLVNLGSPDSPDAPAVRRYLNQFLSDRRVVEIPPFIWQPILKLAILTTRPKRSAANYAKIWDKAENESPLKLYTRRQAEALHGAFGPNVIVDHAMRYANPSIESRLDALRDQGCSRIVIAPLYPQYSLATTGTVLADAFRVLQARREMPAIRTVEPYYADPAYINAMAASLKAELETLDFKPERIMLSFHGMPERTRELGDPYYHQCLETARLLRAATGHTEQTMVVAFQSLFGRAEWLKPYAQPMLQQWAADGIRRVAVMMPGFAADCVETLEEIGLEAREAFLDAGGTDYARIPCLNDSEPGVAMLQSILSKALAGWG